MKATRLMLSSILSLCSLIGYGRVAAGDEPAIAPRAMEQVLPLAEKGDARSENEVGVIFASGRGVPQDFHEAAKWFRESADQEYAPAQFNLGQLYQTGKGVALDATEAAKWVGLAARQGNAAAQGRLAAMYLIGSGVGQDDAEAVRWYRMAAEQGNVIAERQLGLMYALGRGAPQSDEMAARWLNLAAGSGDGVAKQKLAMLPLYKGASSAVNQGFASHPPRDASSPEMAIAMIEGMRRGAEYMQHQCIQLHPELQTEIDRDYSTWKTNEAHAISRSDNQWASEASKPELTQLADSLAKFDARASLDKVHSTNSSVGTELLCKKYFADLASGIWRQRTPRVYEYLDATP
jgi:TPR repeat protein